MKKSDRKVTSNGTMRSKRKNSDNPQLENVVIKEELDSNSVSQETFSSSQQSVDYSRRSSRVVQVKREEEQEETYSRVSKPIKKRRRDNIPLRSFWFKIESDDDESVNHTNHNAIQAEIGLGEKSVIVESNTCADPRKNGSQDCDNNVEVKANVGDGLDEAESNYTEECGEIVNHRKCQTQDSTNSNVTGLSVANEPNNIEVNDEEEVNHRNGFRNTHNRDVTEMDEPNNIEVNNEVYHRKSSQDSHNSDATMVSATDELSNIEMNEEVDQRKCSQDNHNNNVTEKDKPNNTEVNEEEEVYQQKSLQDNHNSDITEINEPNSTEGNNEEEVDHRRSSEDNAIKVRESMQEKKKNRDQETIDDEDDSKKCIECGKQFRYRSLMIIHHRTHTGEKPFACEHCPRAFITNCKLSMHVLQVHNRVRPFKCTKCSARFATKHNLEVHNRTHSGKRPYQCSQCSLRFKQLGNLQTHILAIHQYDRRFQCSQCSARFATKYNLTVHSRIHNGLKPYQCFHCTYSSTQIGNLKAHIKRKHSNKSSR